jgi:hypothetical protein
LSPTVRASSKIFRNKGGRRKKDKIINGYTAYNRPVSACNNSDSHTAGYGYGVLCKEGKPDNQ